jgi:hypothetical protein
LRKRPHGADRILHAKNRDLPGEDRVFCHLLGLCPKSGPLAPAGT